MVRKKWFVDALADRQQSQRALARYMEVDASAITHILNGTRKLQLHEAEQIARFLSVPVEDVLQQAGVKLASSQQKTVPLAGYVDERGFIKPCRNLKVECWNAKFTGLQVHAGWSELDGTLLFYDASETHAPDLMLHRLGVIQQDTTARIGILRRGLEAGRYTISILLAEWHDQPVASFTPILWIQP